MQDETKWSCKVCNVLGSSLTGARYVSVFLQDVRPLSQTVYDIAGQVLFFYTIDERHVLMDPSVMSSCTVSQIVPK